MTSPSSSRTPKTSYIAYVKDQAGTLIAGTQAFADAYAAGDDDTARDLYAKTRVNWERIEPVAESFGDLDPLLDAREADLEEGQAWTGWHRIEKDLWPPAPDANGGETYVPLTTEERAAAAADLVANTEALVDKVNAPDFTFEAFQISNGAKELLDEVASGKVTGEEEIWSHTDLWDFQANVDGAFVAFEVLRDVAEAEDAELVTTLDERFDGAQRAARHARLARGRLQELRRADPGGDPGARRRGRCPGRAPVHAHRHDHGSRMTDRRTLSRRAFLGAAAGGAAVVGAAGLATSGGFGALAAVVGGEPASAAAGTYPFTGAHQAGIVTPAQDRMYTAAFDLTTTSRDELVALLRTWTTMAARLTRRAVRGAVRADERAVRRAARRHRRGPGAGRGRPHAHDRVRAVAVHRAARTPRATGSASPTACPRRSSRSPTSRATTSSRCAATATSSSRRAPTTRRSRCTPCAT